MGLDKNKIDEYCDKNMIEIEFDDEGNAICFRIYGRARDYKNGNNKQ